MTNSEDRFCKIVENNNFGAQETDDGITDFSSSGGFSGNAPIVSTSTSFVFDRERSDLTKKHTVRVIGKHFVADPAGGNSASTIFNAQKSLRDTYSSNKEYKLEITDADGSTVSTLANAKIVSIDFEEGVYLHYGNFVVTFECTEFPGEKLEEFTNETSISTEEGMGYIQDSDVVTDSIYVGTQTVSGSSLILEDAKSEIETYLVAEDESIKIVGDSKTYVAKNVRASSSSASASSATVSISQQFYLVPDTYNDKIMGSISVGVSRSSSSKPTVTIEGSVKAFKDDTDVWTEFKTMQELMYDKALAAELKDEESVRNALSPLTNANRDKHGSAVASSVTHNKTDNSLSFSFEYEISDPYKITNAIYENISITDQPSLWNVAIIPVIGKTNGPLLQSLYSRKETVRVLSVEAIFTQGKSHTTEKGSIDRVINDNTPSGDVLWESDKRETFSENERRYNLEMQWIYNVGSSETFGENGVIEDTPYTDTETRGPSVLSGEIVLPRPEESYFLKFESDGPAGNVDLRAIFELLPDEKIWKFNKDFETFHHLKADDVLKIKYTIRVDPKFPNAKDAKKAVQNIYINIYGTNDNPIFEYEVPEIETADISSSSPTFSGEGWQIFDPDESENVQLFGDPIVSFVGDLGPSLTKQSLASFIEPEVTGGGGTWQLAWEFNATADDFKYLPIDEKLTVTYLLGVIDNEGAVSYRKVEIVITGDNQDAPSIGMDSSQSLTARNVPINKVGTITISNAKPSEVINVSVVSAEISVDDPVDSLDAEVIRQMINFSNSQLQGKEEYEIEYRFDSSPYLFRYLKSGEVTQLTYNLKFDYGYASDEEVLTITINGASDSVIFDGTKDQSAAMSKSNTSASGTFKLYDHDVLESTTVTVKEVVYLKGVLPQDLDPPAPNLSGVKEMLTVSPTSVLNSVKKDDITWEFDGGVSFDYLTSGGWSVHIRYRIEAEDDDGKKDEAFVNISIKGEDEEEEE